MPANNFKPFSTAGGANVLTQTEYEALAALSTGWSSGKANSKEVNKAVRQATFIAAAVAQFVADKSNQDVLDDGNLAGFGTKLIAAINQTSQPLDATLTALAALVGAANKLPYFNGTDTAALTDLTSVGRDLIGKTDIAAVLAYIGFGLRAYTNKDYIRIPDIPGGLIIQWTFGTQTTASNQNPMTIPFPIPFPNILLSTIVGTTGVDNTSDLMFQGVSGTTSAITVLPQAFSTLSNSGPVSATILAIGR